jgi:hypothetical protein
MQGNGSTLDAAIRNFVLDRQIGGCSRPTLEAYNSQPSPLLKWARTRDLTLDAFTEEHLREFLLERARVGQATLYSATVRIKTFFKWCGQRGLCHDWRVGCASLDNRSRSLAPSRSMSFGRFCHFAGDPVSHIGATRHWCGSSSRSEMDTFSDFIDERCVSDAKATAAAGELYRAYREWAEACGEKPLDQRWFGLRLSERGFEKKRTGRVRRWRGLRLSDVTCGDA